MGTFWHRITRPVRLPHSLARWLPRSFTVALGAMTLVVLWSLPMFAPPFHPSFGRAVSGWRLESFAPWAATVPLSALLLLMTAWTGDRRGQFWCLLALWLQAIGIAVCVPLNPYPRAAWLYLALFVISISWIRDAIVARALAGGDELRMALRLRAGLFAVAISLLLWVPFVMSRGFSDRWDNPLFAGAAALLGKHRPQPSFNGTRADRVRTPLAPAWNQPSSPQPPQAAPGYEPPPASLEPVTTQIPMACNSAEETELEAMRTAWENNLASDKLLSIVDVDRQRSDYLRRLFDVRLGGPIRAGLGASLDSSLAMAAELHQRTPGPAQDPRTPPSLAWLRPIASREITAWSYDGVDEGAELHPLEEIAAGSTPPLRVFPIGLQCEHFTQPGHFDASNWISPRIAAGSAAPASVIVKDGKTLVRLEPASMPRVAGVVDFARFVGAPVRVELLKGDDADDELYSRNPSRSSSPRTWTLAVETDLPVFLLHAGKLLPGRLLRATGGDPCRESAPGFEIVTTGTITGPVDGFIMSGSEANATRIKLLATEPNEKSSGNIRRLRQTTQLDLNADSNPDLNFVQSRFQWRGYEEESHWNDSPSYRGSVQLVTESGIAETDLISYVNCERM